MATTARQQYFGDESSIQKERREFSLADELQDKIDSVEYWAQENVIETVKVNWTALIPDADKAVDITVPDVIDNLYTTSQTDALSANQWKILYDYIQNLQSVGRFLSNWDSATWLPVTNPSTSPYTYRAWDYYIVSNVAASPATNYKPDWSSYTSWVASTTVETNTVQVSDRYVYDWTSWILLSSWWGWSIAVDTSLSTTSTNPVENRVITNALNWKQDTLTAWTNITINNNVISAANTTFLPYPNTFNTTWTTAQFLSSISALNLPVWNAYLWQVSLSDMPTWVTVQWDVEVYVYPQNVIYAVMRSAEVPPYVWVVDSYSNTQYSRSWTPEANLYTGSSAPTSSATEWMIWYDTVNDVIKVYDWTNWNAVNTDTTYTAWTWISIDQNNEISNTLPWPTVSSSQPSTASEWDLWYDTTNDVLKVYDGTNWDVVWDDTALMNVKTFYPSSSSDTTTLSEVANWYLAGKTPLISYKNQTYTLQWVFDDITEDNFLDFAFINTAFIGTMENGKWDESPETLTPLTVRRISFRTSLYGSVSTPDRISDMQFASTDLDDYLLQITWNKAQTITWTKTFTTSPIVPNKTTTATNTGTAIATEAQVYKKQDALTAWDNITIEKVCAAISDRKWPAPDGFHVPSYNDWSSVLNAGVTMWLWTLNTTWDIYTSLRSYLKLPDAWYNDGSGVESSWYWYYWTSDYTDNSYQRFVKTLQIWYTWWIQLQELCETNRWRNIRAFKDEPEVPDNSWTTLYDGSSTAAWAWIFRNTTDGLISISSDWTTWYTIMDKNLWATMVYNNWDTKTAANAWNFYQRWNNYWFAYNWTYTTSSTQVDITGYWPWNYYSDDTFITVAPRWVSWGNWSNLWWWASNQIVQSCQNIISSTGPAYTAWTWISIVNWDDYSAMRWPCPEWWHVPLSTELEWITAIWTTLWESGTDWATFWAYLKMPFAWFRDWSIGDTVEQGTTWSYRSVSRGISGYVRTLSISASSINNNWIKYSSRASSIRPFKDVPVAPDSSWTTVLDWSSVVAWAWIFYSSTLWLISLSLDWINRTTIADKNLWATTVWNSGDTLSEANCGKYYQWWNNYEFARTWTYSNISTSQVDASTYWPWNYYSSDTFIKTYWNWDSSSNRNLWWWVTWVIHITNAITNTWVTSVNWQTWDVTISGWGIQLDPNSPINIQYIWAWTEQQYQALQNKSNNTAYLAV